MLNLLLIFFGAGLGGVLRFWVSTSVYALLGGLFPYATLVVNTSGCFLMGLLFQLLLRHAPGFAHDLRAFLLIGLLGGYTTFSAFALETVLLLEGEEYWRALGNILLSVLMCVGASGLGIWAARA
jgi:CrcB protein